jgi:hypothetical protein
MTKNEEAERAWKLWEMLAELESFLWDSYYEYFLEMCMNETIVDEPLDDLDDFPF